MFLRLAVCFVLPLLFCADVVFLLICGAAAVAYIALQQQLLLPPPPPYDEQCIMLVLYKEMRKTRVFVFLEVRRSFSTFKHDFVLPPVSERSYELKASVIASDILARYGLVRSLQPAGGKPPPSA